MGKKTVYKGIDIFKLLAAVGVIAIHTNIPILSTLGRFGVPFFVIVSSFLFFKRYLSLNSQVDKKYQLKKFETRIFLLFISWQILYLPFAIKQTILFFRINGFNFIAILKYCFDFLFRISPSHINGWFVSWYLMAMMLAMHVFVYIYRSFSKSIIVLGVISVVSEIYFILSSEFSFLTHLSNNYKACFPRLFIYLYIGLLIAKNYKIFISKSANFYMYWSVGLIILFLLENYIVYKLGGKISNDETILTAPTSIFITGLAFKYNPYKISSTIFVRNLSTFLYCSQVWLLYIVGKFISLNSLLGELLTFVLIIMLGTILYWIYLKVYRKTHWVFFKYLV